MHKNVFVQVPVNAVVQVPVSVYKVGVQYYLEIILFSTTHFLPSLRLRDMNVEL